MNWNRVFESCRGMLELRGSDDGGSDKYFLVVPAMNWMNNTQVRCLTNGSARLCIAVIIWNQYLFLKYILLFSTCLIEIITHAIDGRAGGLPAFGSLIHRGHFCGCYFQTDERWLLIHSCSKRKMLLLLMLRSLAYTHPSVLGGWP